MIVCNAAWDERAIIFRPQMCLDRVIDFVHHGNREYGCDLYVMYHVLDIVHLYIGFLELVARGFRYQV